jgi:hypothetical protein
MLKHLDVLEGAHLIQRHKLGRTDSAADPTPLQKAQRWLAAYERFWTRPLDALEHGLAQEGEPAFATAAQRINQRSAIPYTFVGFTCAPHRICWAATLHPRRPQALIRTRRSIRLHRR